MVVEDLSSPKWQIHIARLEYLLYPMPWMKYLNASVSLPGCREENTRSGIISPPVINYHTCLQHSDRLNLSHPAAHCSGSEIWQLLAAGAAQSGGLQPDNCGSCLPLANALKCNLLISSTRPPDPLHPIIQPWAACSTTWTTFLFLSHKHRRTHLVNLGHASTVGHLERGGKTQTISI